MEQLCKIRDIQRTIMAFEQRFVAQFGICLNEGMALCSIYQSANQQLTASEIGHLLGLTMSNASKVIASVEKKGLLIRTLDTADKRRMCFSLTPNGMELLKSIKCATLAPPAELASLF